jgi:nicotinamide-nucleotide amidase
MKIEILSIGDELLIGQTVNTNASWMGEQLALMGLAPHRISTVGDDPDDLKSLFELASDRSDVVLVTGGLGPTHDDVTKAVVTAVLESNLILNEDILKDIRERFARRGLAMAHVNENQARVPEKAGILSNDSGTAPGFRFRWRDTLFYVMPGVPSEMKSMMKRFVLPDLQKSIQGPAVKTRVLATTGVPESTLFETLGNIDDIEHLTRLAFLPSLLGVRIRLTAVADTEAAAIDKLDRAEKLIRSRIGTAIYADRDISLQDAVARCLMEHHKTVAVAESCTGGLLASKLTDVSGSSSYFERGVVCYSNNAKIKVLGVSRQLIETYGAVSEPVARAMAKGVRDLSGTDFGLATTGIAGPTGGSADKPVGLVFICLVEGEEMIVQEHHFTHDRYGNKLRTVQAALDLLRKKILGWVSESSTHEPGHSRGH